MSNVGAWLVEQRETPPSNAALDVRAAALLAQPPPGSHIVHAYRRPVFLAEAAATFVVEGLRRNEGVVVIGTSSRWQNLCARLDAAGIDDRKAVQEGRVRFFGAASILAQWFEQRNDGAAFERAIGKLVVMARIRHASVRVYSDLAETLRRRGHAEDALRMENCWQEYAANLPLSVLCSCSMDIADRDAYDGRLRALCRAHTHFLPNSDHAWFNSAVSAAMIEVMDPPHLRMAQTLARIHGFGMELPDGQALLLWLSENMPRTADHVLAIVRERRLAVIPP